MINSELWGKRTIRIWVMAATLRHLEAFIGEYVAPAGFFCGGPGRSTSRRPALTSVIQNLEQQLGAILFERTRRRGCNVTDRRRETAATWSD
jgi:hypothetical protein